jgi:hypothetical protein
MPSFDEMTKEEGIERVYPGFSHVVILGAGASIASTIYNPERSGKRLPSMENFIEVVELGDLLGSSKGNFEVIYSHLYDQDPNSNVVKELEKKVFLYFESLQLPDSPTLYDYLILSLRSKDLIATFNWDPFLFQAFLRINRLLRERNLREVLPHMSFLHGSVAVGYSPKEHRAGPIGMFGPQARDEFAAVPLLYPVTNKNYNKNEFISREWDRLKYWLEDAKRLTIFGYGAPATDVEAVDLMSSAWGSPNQRNMEQIEMIDVQPGEILAERWRRFIHTHHYDCFSSYFKSSLALFPRRTGERFQTQFMPVTPGEAFQEANPIPQTFSSLEALVDWHTPLFEAELRELKE